MASRWTIKKDGSLYGIRGDTAELQFTVKSGGVAANLTGCTVTAECRTGPRPAYKFLTFDTSSSDLPNGIIRLKASAATTGAIEKTEGVWDVQISYENGTVFTAIGPSKSVVIEKDTTL